MRDSGTMAVLAGSGAIQAATRELYVVLERLRTAGHGGDELDALLARALAHATQAAPDLVTIMGGGGPALVARWSTNLSDALALLPPDYNFSLGQRDGVHWAWIQPNDRWEPSEYESRHDHPGGSGLVVARAAALALTCAALILMIRFLERRPCR